MIRTALCHAAKNRLCGGQSVVRLCSCAGGCLFQNRFGMEIAQCAEQYLGTLGMGQRALGNCGNQMAQWYAGISWARPSASSFEGWQSIADSAGRAALLWRSNSLTGCNLCIQRPISIATLACAQDLCILWGQQTSNAADAPVCRPVFRSKLCFYIVQRNSPCSTIGSSW